MRLSFLIVACAMLVGCSAKRVQIHHIEYSPTREELLVGYQSSGSWCIDALIVNFLNVGCSEVTSERDPDGVTHIECASAQMGATDVFSNSSFLVFPAWSSKDNFPPPDQSFIACMDGNVQIFVTQ
jgi:hypothetical protein